MAELPRGTVTLLFTDIQRSTELVKRLREQYPEVVAEHRRLLRETFAEHGGTVVDSQGDAFFVAFGHARDAVDAAVAAQRALARHVWPNEADVSVRMGLHTAEPYVRDQRYSGVGVHRAARICTLAHGGQVLLSRSTAAILDDEELVGVDVRDLGEHRLKGIARPERVFQLVVDGLPSEFPPLQTIDRQVPLSGTVTLVFTDVRHSTSLLRELTPEEFSTLLSDYRGLLRKVLEDAGGREFEVAHDSVVAAFPTAKTAALAAAAAQQAISIHEWPRGLTLTVSVALHSGEAGIGWVGPAVERCARLCDLAQPGQIVLSQAAAGLLEDEDLGELSVRDLGEKPVEGSERAVQLYELFVSTVAKTTDNARHFTPNQTR
jgi:class 3 adenylate cyclase